jgi:hypothetical protein
MLKRITAFLARRAPNIFRRRRYSGLRVVKRMSDVPAETGSLIYLVERNGRRLWAVLECPCRLGHRLSVSLQASDNPHWTLKSKGNLATIHPSLWYRDQCRSHFWITRNQVKWASECRTE